MLHLRIAIIGGGPAGLTLATLLHRQNIPVTIYELRQNPTAAELSQPSGMLDLHEESGLAALRESGLYETFTTLTGDCSEAQRVADKTGAIVYSDEGELSQRPEISRHALTRLLSGSLPANVIQYGHKLLSAQSTTTNEIELDFGPNGKQTYDLVVGADGAWSRVRNALTSAKPHYTGTQTITGTISNISARFPQLASLVGNGSFSALGNRHGVMSQRGPGDSARTYAFLSVADESSAMLSKLQTAEFEEAKQILLNDESLLGGFGKLLKDLASTSWDEEFSTANKIDIKPLYTLPIDSSFPHCPGASLTLIGDAAHLMPPWAGEGVNLAMWDALLLSRAITQAFHQNQCRKLFLAALDPLLQEFEKDMFARAREKAEETEKNGKMLFGEDGATAFKEFFESVYGPWEGVGEA